MTCSFWLSDGGKAVKKFVDNERSGPVGAKYGKPLHCYWHGENDLKLYNKGGSKHKMVNSKKNWNKFFTDYQLLRTMPTEELFNASKDIILKYWAKKEPSFIKHVKKKPV